MQLTDLVFIDSTGYHFSDYPSFLLWAQQQYQLIYGADVYLEPDSQDGQYVAIQAQAFYDCAALGASVYNSFSPVTAQGTGLSRNVKINGLTRRPPTFSTVDLDLGGTVGTTSLGWIAIDTLNQQWLIPDGTIIPDAGTITVTATAQSAGAIQALPDTVNRIFTPTQGWQTVNNASAAAIGQAVESDAALRNRQIISTANPSLTVFEGTIGAVFNVPGVTDVRGYENDTDSTDSNGIPAHSISLVVVGGDAMEIAQTIANHKTPGTGTFGTTSELVTDSKGVPITIHFFRPTDVSIQVQVSIDTLAGYAAGYAEQIQQSVAAYVNALDIGNSVLITKIYVPANVPGTPAAATFDITSIEIGKNGGSLGTSNIAIAFNELPTCDPDTDVMVVV